MMRGQIKRVHVFDDSTFVTEGYFSSFLHKNTFWYSLGLPQTGSNLMSTHKACFYRERKKLNYP